MGLFKRKVQAPPNVDDPALGDAAWLDAGDDRYRAGIGDHYGSPDTIAAGGDQRRQQGDVASALFFYEKAIDTLHSIYVCGFEDTGPAGWVRQPSQRDLDIVDRYLATLRQVRERRPGAPIEATVREVTHRLRTISTELDRHGLGSSAHRDRLAALGEIAPDVDVSGVYWS
jgi:hypothetical protein